MSETATPSRRSYEGFSLISLLRFHRRSCQGFTLIELLVVIVIIGVLSTIGLATYSNAQKSARDAKRKADLNQINLYLQYYYNDNGRYPAAGECAIGTGGCNYSTAGDSWIPALVSGGYTTRLPVDPINNTDGPWNATSDNYSYAYGNVSSDGQNYDLTARLENTSDPDRCGVKDWKWYNGMPGGPNNWCPPSGSYSPQIYEASPDR